MTDWAKTQTHKATEVASHIKVRFTIGVVLFAPAVLIKIIDPGATIRFFS